MSASNEGDNLDWMYKNSNEIVDREEYLLGRRLDKNVDSQSTTNDAESIPGSIFSLPESTNRIDALRKMKEDPLEAIKEKEREMRKELLKNPIQMKKIQKMLEAQRSKCEPKNKKEKKKKKKSRDVDSDRMDDDNALDALLSAKLSKLIKKYGKDKIFNSSEDNRIDKKKKDKKTKHDSSSSSSSENDSSEEDSDEDRKPKKIPKFQSRDRRKQKFPKRSSRRSTSSDSSQESESDRRAKISKMKLKPSQSESRDSRSNIKKESMEYRLRNPSPKETKPFGLYVPEGARKSNSHEFSQRKQESPRRSKDVYKDRKRDESDDRNRYSRNYRDRDSRNDRRDRSRSRDKDRVRSRDRDRERVRSRSRDKDRPWNRNKKSQMSHEEKEKRLKEMMDNVSWRNDLMEKNSKIHKEQLKKEESQPQTFSEDFARKQFSKGIYSETVEKRIKSKLQNIQRSSFAMDKNFAKR